MFIRYLVPEIEQLEYESLGKVVYQTTVLSRCFEQVLLSEILTVPGFP